MSCVMVGANQNREITTIEGLQAEMARYAIQRIWVEENVAQCGYCQSGQIMSALARSFNGMVRTASDIDAIMSGNLADADISKNPAGDSTYCRVDARRELQSSQQRRSR